MRDSLTNTQRKTLLHIRDIRDAQVRRVQRYIDENQLKENKPSEWIFVSELKGTQIRRDTIAVLVRLGYLETRPSGGFGPEIRLKGGSES